MRFCILDDIENRTYDYRCVRNWFRGRGNPAAYFNIDIEIPMADRRYLYVFKTVFSNDAHFVYVLNISIVFFFLFLFECHYISDTNKLSILTCASDSFQAVLL